MKRRIVVQNSRLASTSMATVGSSSTSSDGLLTSATAKRTRWVWPPDSRWVRRSAMSLMPVIASVSSTEKGCGYS